MTGKDWLGFGGIAPPAFPIISAEQQFAEKLHAYTLPRSERTNTRTKDLIEKVLLIRGGKLDRKKTAAAVRATFTRRATHEVPGKLESPPRKWALVFDGLATECGLEMKIDEGFRVVREFTEALKI